MSFSSRLVHSLAIVVPTDAGARDADGQPVAGPPIVTTVKGLVRPRSARERALPSEAGPEIATHVVYLEPIDVPAGAWIRDEPDAGRRYDITGVRRYDFGAAPHLEIDTRLVTSAALEAAP
jgi:hypothetical protein